MASTSTKPDGRRIVQFVGPDRKRHTVPLGRVDADYVKRFQAHVEALVLRAKSPDRFPLEKTTLEWLGRLDERIHAKLAGAGLCEPRGPARPQGVALGNFLKEYIDGRSDVKRATTIVWGHTRRCLLEFFGEDKPIDTITPGDADKFLVFLRAKKLAENTIARRCSFARQFFRAALRRKLIAENPFTDLKGLNSGRNVKRERFITREVVQKVLDACPDAQWRLIFALSRYGGLRCPSEHLALRWSDINWEQGRMTIHSPKTEHHPGRDSRVMPIFPELRMYLEAVWEQAEPGTVWVITRYRDTNANLRTQLLRIIGRAGVASWPKLFHNLRASRATELVEVFPSHVAAAWLGHTEAIADKHYRQVTEDHFAQATNPSKVALQKALQYGVAQSRTENEKGSKVPQCETMRACTSGQVEVMGLEPTNPLVANQVLSQLSYTPKCFYHAFSMPLLNLSFSRTFGK
jgi:integrase